MCPRVMIAILQHHLHHQEMVVQNETIFEGATTSRFHDISQRPSHSRIPWGPKHQPHVCSEDQSLGRRSFGRLSPCYLEIRDLGLHEPIRAKCFHRHGRTIGKISDMSQFFNDYMFENTIRQFQISRSQEMQQPLRASCPACLHFQTASWYIVSRCVTLVLSICSRLSPGMFNSHVCSKEVNMVWT